jgi:hypothetical protein
MATENLEEIPAAGPARWPIPPETPAEKDQSNIPAEEARTRHNPAGQLSPKSVIPRRDDDQQKRPKPPVERLFSAREHFPDSSDAGRDGAIMTGNRVERAMERMAALTDVERRRRRSGAMRGGHRRRHRNSASEVHRRS